MRMPNYNLANLKVFFSFEDAEEVLNLRIDKDTCYSANVSTLPSDIVTKLTANGLDFQLQLNPDFLYALISYFETGGRYAVDSNLFYKGLSRKIGRNNFTFLPKPKIRIGDFFQRRLQAAYSNNSKSFFDWADVLLTLLSFCEDSENALNNLLKVIHLQSNEIFVVGSLVQVEDCTYNVRPQLTVANLLAGQNCTPICYPLAEFLPDCLIASETGVVLSQPSSEIVNQQALYSQLQQALIERVSNLPINLLPENHQEAPLDIYSQEELDLENELFYTPILDLLYGL